MLGLGLCVSRARASRSLRQGRIYRRRTVIASQICLPRYTAPAAKRKPDMTRADAFDPRWLGLSIPAAQWHFHRQLLRRYKIVLAPGDFSAMLAAIQKGRALLIEQQANGRAVFHVRVPSAGERIYLLVSRNGQVITALMPSKRFSDMRRALRGKRRPNGPSLIP